MGHLLEVPCEAPAVVLLPLAVVLNVQKAIRKMKFGVVRIDTATRVVDVPTVASFPYPKHDDETFPPWRQVLPDMKDHGRPGVRWVGVNGTYLGEAQAAFCDAAGSGKSGQVMMIEFSGELDPTRITASGSDLEIVVMPARTDGPGGSSIVGYPAIRKCDQPDKEGKKDGRRAA